MARRHGGTWKVHRKKTLYKNGKTIVHAHGDHSHAVLGFPTGLLEYDRTQIDIKLPQTLAANASEPVFLKPARIRELGVFAAESSRLINDISTQNEASNRFGSQILTGRLIDLLANQQLQRRRSLNAGAFEALEHTVPTLENTPLKVLLKLREKEGEAFQMYRQNISAALEKAGTLSKREARELLADTVLPDIQKINTAISNAKKLSNNTTLTDGLTTGATLTLAALASMLPDSLSLAKIMLGAAGATQLIKSAFSRATQQVALPKEALDNRFIFLWRANRLGKS